MLSGVAAAFSSDGALHLAARLRSGSQEGGGWGHLAFLYAREDPGGAVTRFEPVVPDARSSYSGYCDDLIQLLVEGAAAQYLFLETGSGVSLWVDPGGGWRSLQLAPGVPGEAQKLSGSAQQLRTAWSEQDAVQLLTDRWLYRIEGTQIVDAVAVGGSCGRLCYVSHAAGGPVAETLPPEVQEKVKALPGVTDATSVC